MQFSVIFIFFLFNSNAVKTENSDLDSSHSQIISKQLEALTLSLKSLQISKFLQLFNEKTVDVNRVFQPKFLYPDNVFASMGDSEFKNSLKIFTPFQPKLIASGDIQALVTIWYKMGGKSEKMDKEVVVSKSAKSATGYVFTVFDSI